MLNTNSLATFGPWSESYHSIIEARYVLKLQTHNHTILSELSKVLMITNIDDREKILLQNDLSNLIYIFNADYRLENTDKLLDEYFKFRKINLEPESKDILNHIVREHRETFMYYHKSVYDISDSIILYEIYTVKASLIVNLAIGVKE